MRRLLTGLVVAAATALVPMLAWAGNQEIAEEIAKNLRSSGQMHDYKIGVKYQGGTAWLRGQVCSEEQLQTAVDLASRMPGVTRVVNNLSVGAKEAQPSSAPNHQASAPPATTNERIQQAVGALAPEQHARSSAVGSSPTASNEWLTAAAKQLQGLVRAAPQERPVPEPVTEESTTVAIHNAPAQAVASSFTPAPAQPVTAEMEQPAPQPVAVATETRRAPRPMPTAMLAPVPADPTERVPARTVAMAQPVPPQPMMAAPATPLPMGAVPTGAPMGGPAPAYVMSPGAGVAPARYDQPNLPNYSWPSYAAYPNYAAVSYPRQYSPTAWPYIGPFYPYPQVPLGWRKVTLQWNDGWWMLDFKDR